VVPALIISLMMLMGNAEAALREREKTSTKVELQHSKAKVRGLAWLLNESSRDMTNLHYT